MSADIIIGVGAIVVAALVGGASVFAVFKAPLITLRTQEARQEDKELKQRQYNVFETLMSERFLGVSLNKTKAYNLIDVVFYEVPSVLSVWKSYYESLLPYDESDAVRAEICQKNQKDLEVKLLEVMAKHLGYTNIDWKDVGNAYIPRGINNDLDFERKSKANHLQIQDYALVTGHQQMLINQAIMKEKGLELPSNDEVA